MGTGHFTRVLGIRLALIAAGALAQGVVASAAIAQSAAVNSLGPSIAGRTYAFALDPENPDVIYQGGDVNGVYLSEDFGGHWKLWNEGLENGDLTSSFYVDDLLVITQDAEFPVDANRVGVYAATLGGIYFRPRVGGTWTLLTDYQDALYGSQYHYDRADQGARRGFPVPYCTLVYDRATRTLYAGAGNGRYGGADLGLYRNNYTYPGLTSQFTVLDGVDQQYVVWSLDVGATGSHWQPLPLQAGGPTGIARQLAVVQADVGRFLAVGTSDGVYVRNLDLGQSAPWSQVADYASKTILDAVWSGFVWGIAAGSEGRLYALTRGTENANGETKAAGVFYLDLGTAGDGSWHGLDSGLIAPPHAVTFKDLLSTYSPGSLDLCTLTVRPGPTSDEDEVFVGATKTSYGGYFRYGKYRRPTSGGTEEVTGWLQFIYCNPRNWNLFDFYAIDWHSSPYQTKLLYDDAASTNEMGWLTNNSLNAFVPMVIGGGSKMLLDVYHTPMKSVDAGQNWSQTYCTASGSGWSGNGMNLDTTNGIAFDSSGRMYMSANDFGAFEELHAGARDFQWTSWNSTYHWSFGALAVMSGSQGDEIFGAHTPHDGTWNLMRRNRNAQPHSTSTWEKQGQAPGGAKIEQIAVYDTNRLLLAKSSGNGPGLFVCERLPSGDFGDATAISGTANEKFFGVARIPGTQLVVAIGDGRLICFDMEAPSSSMRVWLSSASADPIIRTAIKGASSLYVDRLGRVVYIGTKGNNSPGAVGANDAIGTILRIRGPFATSDAPAASSVTVLANSGAGDHPFGFAEAFFGCAGHEGDENERYTHVRAIATDINNPNRVYVGLGVPSFDYQGNMHPKNGVWLYDETNLIAGSPWRQVFGASSTQERGANRPVTVLTTGLAGPQLGGAPLDTLYIGTDGQGPFWIPVDVTAPPVIAAAAIYQVVAGAAGAVHAIGVRVTPVPSTIVETVTVDLRPWGGDANEPLLDNGEAPDLVGGDGIFTSQLLSADFGAPGMVTVTVFAQASDGGYASSTVALEVIENPIDQNAVYRFRAGSTDASHVLAVAMTSPPAWSQVTADLSSVSGPADIDLLDDGLGEDVKAADGIYTSARFTALMPDPGTYAASVAATPIVGGPVTQSVSMAAVPMTAKFKNDADFEPTERLGEALAAGLPARPYSSVYFVASPNNGESDRVMVTTFDDNDTPPGIWGRIVLGNGGEGRFESRGSQSQPSWLVGDLPEGSRGVCYADFDNDGDTDFFICNPTYGGKLFVNYLNDTSCPAAWQGKFINRTSAICGADSVYLDGALAASWGDYTGDGFVDLFVSTGTYTAPIDEIDELPASAQSGMNGGDLRLFRNTMGSALRKSLVWGSLTGAACLTGCWVDLDNDGDLDHVSTRYVDGGVGVLENRGINAAHTDQVMEPVTWAIAEPFYGGNSVTVIDYDHDPYPDLLVTEVASGHQQARILRNRFGSSQSREFDSTTFAVGQVWNGAVVADFNLDGQDDFVLLPRSADVVPAAFMSTDMPAPEFEDWPAIQPTGEPTTPTYRDLGYTLGIRDGRTGGGFAADLDGDHAPDLFLGRDMLGNQGQSSGDQCLYRSTGSAGTTNHRLQVNLRTRGDSNGSLIGTKVQVVAGSKQWLKSVDGGSFRGGQGTNDLLFGLGSETSIDHVSVVFPSGETKIISQPAVDVTLEVREDDMDALTYPRPWTAYELEPGFVGLVFRWKTGAIKGDLRQDKVEFYPYGGSASNAVTLQWGVPDVSVVAYRENGIWIHELRYYGIHCFEGLRWTFRASSSAGVGGEIIAPVEWKDTPVVNYCMPENYGQ